MCADFSLGPDCMHPASLSSNLFVSFYISSAISLCVILLILYVLHGLSYRYSWWRSCSQHAKFNNGHHIFNDWISQFFAMLDIFYTIIQWQNIYIHISTCLRKKKLVLLIIWMSYMRLWRWYFFSLGIVLTRRNEKLQFHLPFFIPFDSFRCNLCFRFHFSFPSAVFFSCVNRRHYTYRTYSLVCIYVWHVVRSN